MDAANKAVPYIGEHMSKGSCGTSQRSQSRGKQASEANYKEGLTPVVQFSFYSNQSRKQITCLLNEPDL